MIFRSSPKLAVFAPRTLVANSDAEIAVELVADRVTRVTSVDAWVVGTQGWSLGQTDTPASRLVGPRIGVRLLRATTLPVGPTRLPLRFRLPDMPPTHHVAPALSELLVTVRVAMPWFHERPWWPDGKRTFALRVQARTPPQLARTPGAFRSETPSDSAPRIELGIASTTLVAGELVRGSFAIYHVDDRKPRDVEIAFQPVLRLHGRFQHRTVVATGYIATVVLPAGAAGKSVPFAVRLPAAATPSFRAATHDLDWTVVVSIAHGRVGPRLELAVPVIIHDAAAARFAPRLAPPPRLGDERVLQVFERFAKSAHGWRVVDDALQRVDGDSRMRMTYDYRGRGGTFLCTSIAHAPLGLGLRTNKRKRGAAAIAPRSAAQGDAFVREVTAVAERLAPDLGPIVSWHDDAIALELAIETLESATLDDAADALVHLELAVRFGRAAIAPPPGLAVDVPAWQALASRLHGALCPGDLAIAGHVDGVPVRVSLAFDDRGAPAALIASAGSPERAPEAVRAVALDAQEPAAYGRQHASDDDGASAAARQLATWPPDVASLIVLDGVASARRQIAGGAAEAAHARQLVELLCALLSALGPGTGPYR